MEIANNQNGHDNVTIALVHCQVKYSEPKSTLHTALANPSTLPVTSNIQIKTPQVASPLGKNQKTQVWDFKTGKITAENLSHYWTQLSAYAYALYQLGVVGPTEGIELVLCFVDQKKNLEKVVTKAECDDRLESWARKIFEHTEATLDVRGREHIAPGKTYLVMSNHQSHYDVR